jgi:hypothetical protein
MLQKKAILLKNTTSRLPIYTMVAKGGKAGKSVNVKKWRLIERTKINLNNGGNPAAKQTNNNHAD